MIWFWRTGWRQDRRRLEDRIEQVSERVEGLLEQRLGYLEARVANLEAELADLKRQEMTPRQWWEIDKEAG